MGEGETIGAQSMDATTSRALSRSVEIKVLRTAPPAAAAPPTAADAPGEEKKGEKDAKKDK
jgi:hypothetical protein